MFTGIVEEVGTIQSVKKGAKSCILTIGCHDVLEQTKIGDSIMTDGVCLTATTVGNRYFTADVMAETLNRSALGKLKAGDKVNLERAMPANGRFDGHMVAGHIDGVGIITDRRRDDNAVWYTIETAPPVLEGIVEKGSIALSGISLTVASVGPKSFDVSIIPHTLEVTSLGTKKIGDAVNLECDMVGKYIQKWCDNHFKTQPENSQNEGLTLDFLEQCGYQK